MSYTWLEATDNRSPTGAGFSQEGGKCVSTWYLDAPTLSDLTNAPKAILGFVDIAKGSGAFAGQRLITPPICDPVYSQLFAESITGIRGVGQYTLADGNSPPDASITPISTHFALYPKYEYTVNFAPRPYNVMADNDIDVHHDSYYPETNGGTTGLPYFYFDEYLRYTTYDFTPANEAVTAQLGQMTFNSTSSCNGSPYQGTAKMFLPNQILKVTMFNVPYRWILSDNSYIAGCSRRPSWIGRINQTAFYFLDGILFDAGSLMYLGYQVQKFQPPVPGLETIGGTQVYEKICTVTMNFLWTRRYLPSGETPARPPSNGNYVVGGHNLLPWFVDRQFHYADAVPNTGLGSEPVCEFLSAPLQLLWTDPDVDQGI